jgi:nitrous oxidase accessory protein
MKKRIITLITTGIFISNIFIAGCIEQTKPPISSLSIQKMINNALDGETIYINSGIYNENIIINKSITLMGEDKNTTIIKGEGGNVVFITADNCILEGFTINNIEKTEETSIGININANYTTIKNNKISSNNYGIVFDKSSKGNNVVDNNISHNTYGLYILTSSMNNITSNILFSNIDKGIYISRSNHTIVIGNNISNGKYGISMIFSENNTISNNDIYSNIQYGIYIGSESNNNVIKLNIIYSNDLAIRIRDSFLNNITKNKIENNQEGVLTCCESKNNTLYKNIIKNNTDWNAEGNLNNKWDFDGFGNYWADYSGVDSNNDNIGDTPYIFIGGQDNYPLINESMIYEPKK